MVRGYFRENASDVVGVPAWSVPVGLAVGVALRPHVIREGVELRHQPSPRCAKAVLLFRAVRAPRNTRVSSRTRASRSLHAMVASPATGAATSTRSPAWSPKLKKENRAHEQLIEQGSLGQ